jgi:transcription elongation factor GreA-like protein
MDIDREISTKANINCVEEIFQICRWTKGIKNQIKNWKIRKYLINGVINNSNNWTHYVKIIEPHNVPIQIMNFYCQREENTLGVQISPEGRVH